MPKLLPKNSKYHKQKLVPNYVYHSPVLETEAADWLNVKPGERYVDATVGGGSHTAQIINRGGIVLGLDQDPDAISACLALYQTEIQSRHLILVQANFTHLLDVLAKQDWRQISGVLFDLGISQHQVQTPQRGFSFQSDGPLDMRMDTTLPHTAATLVNSLNELQLTQLFTKFGEEPQAKLIARKILAHRPITTTQSLADVIGHPQSMRRVFQALRIAVNDELGAIAQTLPQALNALSNGGRMVVISFHSLEDRLIKHQFVQWQDENLGRILTPKPILGERESKLRAFEKNEKTVPNSYSQSGTGRSSASSGAGPVG